MELFTAEIEARLLEDGRKQEPVRGTDDEIDFHAVVKFFTPEAGCTWPLAHLRHFAAQSTHKLLIYNERIAAARIS